tara:strand:- start:183 stop:302 length:120 start_codon:yes stop_codon:yes gene_type:complete
MAVRGGEQSRPSPFSVAAALLSLRRARLPHIEADVESNV